ncbi:hypothetical protein C1J03_23125 [Sulfitobacter sp. SK012]|uniref:hypothetical protein n=1 Tax=Sulfitobacter sp. SK012 TaxID=1389005 RepID=UPI000E0C260D|nr:hypothetical protein [Sulfitobacter sp. SK012]AXI48636.1 hypothetical protein C1J03_23125 [Sulfitobacter sp. SK012]
MSVFAKFESSEAEKLIELVSRERSIALSAREWKHRLAGYGYAIRAADTGHHMLQSLSKKIDVCILPQDLFA